MAKHAGGNRGGYRRLALERLPAAARTYLRYRFLDEPPLPPRRIAQLMGVSVDELYRRRRQWETMLIAELKALGIKKYPETSV